MRAVVRCGFALRATVSRALATCMLAAGLASCWHRPSAPPPVSPAPVAARIVLTPLDLSPDGEARLLVAVRYRDAAGRPAHVPPGGNVTVTPSRGQVQWQPRARYGDPAAIVRVTEAGPLAIHVDSTIAHLPRKLDAKTDTRGWRLPAVTARALGPHAVALGWFPRVHEGSVEIERRTVGGVRIGFAVDPPSSSFRDTTAEPGAQYTYAVRRPGHRAIDVGVGVPPDLPASSVDVVRGKGMWLSFDDDVRTWNVEAMLDRAQSAGVRSIALRMTYGEVDEVTTARRAVIDRFIDGAAARGIAIVAWTVPREVSFEDLAATVAAAAYRTAAGNGIRGLAVDLERGPEFMGNGEAGRAALAAYLPRLREAIGSHVLVVATVEDPHLETIGDDVPYAAIAAAADVLQPMVYWRARKTGASIAGMQAQLRASVARLHSLIGPQALLDIGGQTAALPNGFGPPPPAEVAASLTTARELGAIGETFFDWDSTTQAQWAAIARTDWPL